MIDVYSTIGGSPFSADSAWSNPLTVTANGFRGQTIIKKLYVRNDEIDKWYEDVSVLPVQLVGTPNWIDGSDGHSWKLIGGDTEPTEEEWEAVSAANTINLGAIGGVGVGDTSTYLPFWVRVVVHERTAIRSLTNVVSLDIEFDEHVV